MPTFDRSPGCRWFLPALVVVLVLGHACEVPAFADLVAPSHHADGSHHSPGGHPDAEMVSCDGAALVSSGGGSAVRVGLDVALERPVFSRSFVRTVAGRSLDSEAGLATRPPLFLLFASLLI